MPIFPTSIILVKTHRLFILLKGTSSLQRWMNRWSAATEVKLRMQTVHSLIPAEARGQYKIVPT